MQRDPVGIPIQLRWGSAAVSVMLVWGRLALAAPFGGGRSLRPLPAGLRHCEDRGSGAVWTASILWTTD